MHSRAEREALFPLRDEGEKREREETAAEQRSQDVSMQCRTRSRSVRRRHRAGPGAETPKGGEKNGVAD